jgi:hypothetical protein
MILDSFKLQTASIQIEFSDAFELWDKAGRICKRLSQIWPDLKVVDAHPNQQSLRAKGVNFQFGLTQAVMTLTGAKAFDQSKVEQVKGSFEVLREELALGDLKRVSTLGNYVKDFASLKEANAEILGLKLAKWPSVKVFDQPTDSERNGLDISYRFEDEKSFAFLRICSEQRKYEVNLDPDYIEEPEIRKLKCRVVIAFDRGLLGSVDAQKFRMDDWLKGFQHILRRDIDKVIKG